MLYLCLSFQGNASGQFYSIHIYERTFNVECFYGYSCYFNLWDKARINVNRDKKNDITIVSKYVKLSIWREATIKLKNYWCIKLLHERVYKLELV